MSDYRPDSIYVRRETRRALFYIPMEPDQTIDDLCDSIISKWLALHHPEIIKHMEQQKEADDQFKKRYKKTPF